MITLISTEMCWKMFLWYFKSFT